MTHAMEHCDRPWWKRPPVWFIAIAAGLLLAVAVMEQTGKRAATPYGAFLDQVEAGNIASVTFQGTEITGRFKHPLDKSPSGGTAQGDSFRTHVPDFGDPALIPELRRQHVAIDVKSPSAWTWLLGRVPWPMLIFVGAILVAGVVRLARGGKAQPGSAAPTLPAHGMIGLVSGLFTKRREDASPPPRDSDEVNGR
jgi:ATP-dependent Zn protease